jgi:hypothetical protein
MTDEKIIDLIQTGRTDNVLKDLYKNFPMMRKMILSKGGRSQDAEDVFQESLIIPVNKIRKSDFKLTANAHFVSPANFLAASESIDERSLSRLFS